MIGACLSWRLDNNLTRKTALGDPVSGPIVIEGLLMALGVWLPLSERHEHEHTHEEITHEHYTDSPTGIGIPADQHSCEKCLII